MRIVTNIEWGDANEKLSIWYAKPKPNVLIAATHAGFLKTVLQRVVHPPAACSPLLDFPEWKYVDTKAGVGNPASSHCRPHLDRCKGVGRSASSYRT